MLLKIKESFILQYEHKAINTVPFILNSFLHFRKLEGHKLS